MEFSFLVSLFSMVFPFLRAGGILVILKLRHSLIIASKFLLHLFFMSFFLFFMLLSLILMLLNLVISLFLIMLLFVLGYKVCWIKFLLTRHWNWLRIHQRSKLLLPWHDRPMIMLINSHVLSIYNLFLLFLCLRFFLCFSLFNRDRISFWDKGNWIKLLFSN